MDVFGIAVSAGGDFLREAAIAAGHDLELYAQLAARPRTVGELAADLGLPHARRLRALVDVLVALGPLGRDGDRFVTRETPARPIVPRSGWGQIAEVIRTDRPLGVPGGDLERRMHEHLARSGAAAAAELAPILRPGSLVDLGGGAGAYTHAYLSAHPSSRATLVDFHEVVGLARAHLAPHGARVRFVASEITTAQLPGDDGGAHDVALLANVVHLHGARMCEQLVAAAARAIAPDGAVVIKDLGVAEDRSGPLASLLFALNMAVYTGEGDVYPTSQLRAWLVAAGLAHVTEIKLAASPEAVVLAGWRA